MLIIKNFKVLFLIIRREIFSPSKSISKFILFIFNMLRFKIKRNIELDKNRNNIFIWDIRVNSITFDFVWVIYNAYFYFKCPKDGFQIVIFKSADYIPKPFSWNSYDKFVNDKEMIARIKKMILVMAKAFSCINKITIVSEPKILYEIINSNSNILPKYFHPNIYSPQPLCYKKVHRLLKTKFDLISPLMNSKNLLKTKNYLTSVAEFGEYITFSLRDYGFSPDRNSSQLDIDLAVKFAKLLKCKLVVIPDNISKLKNYNLERVSLVSKSSREYLENRLDLYSKSLVNILPPCGPATASMHLINSKTIIVNYAKGDIDNPAFYKKYYGTKIGDQPYLKLNTYLIWHEIYPNYNINDLFLAYKEINNT